MGVTISRALDRICTQTTDHPQWTGSDFWKTISSPRFFIKQVKRSRKKLFARVRAAQAAIAVIREQNSKSAIARGFPPFQAATEDTQEPIAVVCSGPSLKETWQALRQFSKIISCSGAHNFLIERGIIRTYHIEIDCEEQKAMFVKKPHRDVQYLIAACCHPTLFDFLMGFDVKIWHWIKGDIRGDEDIMDYPPGHWILNGTGPNGQMATVMARVLGHLSIHVFGMDCCSDGNAFHANWHPNENREHEHRIVKVAGRTFLSTLEYHRAAQRFLNLIKAFDAQITLYGDGLLQAMVIQEKLNDPEVVRKKQAKAGPRKVCLGLEIPAHP